MAQVKPMYTTNTGGSVFLKRVYDSTSQDEVTSAYEEWASTYDEELRGESHGYVAPSLIAQHVLSLKGTGSPSDLILDAGCGTGLVGVSLKAAGIKAAIDGLDLSPGMLKVAEKSGAYRNLQTVDLSKPISNKDEEYDILTSSGTLTQGHVGPDPALREFVRVVKKGGIVVTTVLEDIWVSNGYKAEVEKLKSEGLVEVVSDKSEDYRRGADVRAIMLILKKL